MATGDFEEINGASSMGMQLKVKNFRCLRDVDWSPDGVCMLVGPNGSGKSTLFDALSFLYILHHQNNVIAAIQRLGGQFFRNLNVPPSEPVSFIISQGSYSWEIQLPLIGEDPLGVERVLKAGNELLVRRSLGKDQYLLSGQWINDRMPMSALNAALVLSLARPDQQTGEISALFRKVEGFVIYGTYALHQLRLNLSQPSADLRLSANGDNAYTVLRNWRDKRETSGAYQFVVENLRQAFPGVFAELDFESTAQFTSLRFATTLTGKAIPATFAANGLLVGLLHLMAVVGAEPGTLVAIDEFENSLHPYAIRSLVQAMREWAAEKDLTVVLAGHSPALLDEFKECPSQVFVMEPWRPGQPSMPRRLTDYHDPEWLKHFSLGELYRHEEFGGPNGAATNAALAGTAS
jgi:predicted ATPase